MNMSTVLESALAKLPEARANLLYTEASALKNAIEAVKLDDCALREAATNMEGIVETLDARGVATLGRRDIAWLQATVTHIDKVLTR
jgi:methionine synthase II (cobalamin-independent)